MPDFATWDDYDLLEALELAGRLPDPGLIRACLDRRATLTPGLLDMLARGTMPHWDADDPRWYRDVHAGLLLIAFREEAALPAFDAILRDPERSDLVSEWYLPWLPEYGPKVVPMLLRLAQDADADFGARVTALRLLGVVGERYGSARTRILPALRALLPPLDDDGRPVAGEAPSEEETGLWNWTVATLTSLGDVDSEAHVRALFRVGLLDEDVTGTEDEYRDDVAEPFFDDAPDDAEPAMDLVSFYETLGQWDRLSDEDLVETLHHTLLQAGADPATAGSVRDEMLTALRQIEDEDDEDVAAAVLEQLAERLRAHGVHEDRLEEALNAFTMEELDEDAGDDLLPWAEHPGAAIRERDDYDRMTPDELVDALAWAGRTPDAALVRALQEHRQAVAPALLELLAAEVRDDEEDRWEDDDPRWYRDVHAGLLLIGFREEAALPLFAEILRDDAFEVHLEWFNEHLAAYGPAAVPMLMEVLDDDQASVWGRIGAATNLAGVAYANPAERDAIVAALRATLPALDEVAELDARELDEDDETLWTFVASELAGLRDEGSREVITRLFERGLLDETIFGDLKEYRKIMAGAQKEWMKPVSADFDAVDYYEKLSRRTRAEEARGEWRREAAEDDVFGDDDRYEDLPAETFERERPKIGRNEKVTIRDPRTGATETLKYKHAQKKLDEGWEMV